MSNNSFPSRPYQSGNMFNRPTSIVDEDIGAPTGPPSYPTGGTNSFPYHEHQSGPREVIFGPDDVAPGSLSDMRPFQVSSNYMKDRNSVVSGRVIGEAPEFDGVVHVNGSLTNGIGRNQYSDGTNAPGLSNIGRENHSNNPTGGEASNGNGEINQADYVGISLVGKKFKEVNPTAYYVEKDDDPN